MLVEIAISDSYGGGFEFTTSATRQDKNLKNDLSQYYPHPLGGLPAGSYTDDTQMTIAIAEAMIKLHHFDHLWDENYIMAHFFRTYKRDPRKGYSRKMQNLLEKSKTVTQFKNICIPYSDRCGAAMKSCPIGLFKDPMEVWEKAAIQARITHNSIDGILGSVVVALAVHHQFYNLGSITEMPDWISDFICNSIFGRRYKHYGKATAHVNSSAVEVVSAALWAVSNPNLNDNSISNLLKTCNDFTGDTDSVSAIAVGIASVSKDWVNDLPDNLIRGLENGEYGRDFLQSLDAELFECVDA